MCVLLAVASSICEWLMHEPLVPVYIFSGLVWNTKFQKHWSHSQDLLIDDMRSRCTNFMYGLNIFFFLVFFAYFVLAACMYSSKEQCIVSWKKQDGWICQGRCPHVSQSAGRKLHWHRHTNTHIAHNIHPICHPGPHSSWSNTSFLYFSWPCTASNTVFSSLENWFHLCDVNTLERDHVKFLTTATVEVTVGTEWQHFKFPFIS